MSYNELLCDRDVTLTLALLNLMFMHLSANDTYLVDTCMCQRVLIIDGTRDSLGPIGRV